MAHHSSISLAVHCRTRLQENALISFIIDQLTKHCRPQELLNNLMDVLENDAELFVKKLWRVLIFHMIDAEKATATQ